jgi:hypothetical protein
LTAKLAVSVARHTAAAAREAILPGMHRHPAGPADRPRGYVKIRVTPRRLPKLVRIAWSLRKAERKRRIESKGKRK